MIPPVSGGSGTRILELREAPFTSAILGELTDRLADLGDGAVVGFLGRTRATPGTPAPGQEAEAARHAGRSVESLEYEAHDTMALAMLATIADEIEARFGVTGLAIVHRIGVVPLGEPSIAVVAVVTASGCGVRGGALRDRRDEGPGPDLEGRAVRRRPRLDRPPGPDRARGGGVMRVYISVDMEGIGGVSHPHPTDPANARYPAAVELMVGETNAAIEGALAAGATDILVNDSHWNMYNLLPEALHPARARPPGREGVVDGGGRGAGPDGAPGLRRRAVRRLSRPGRPPARDDRPHLLGTPGRDAPRRPPDRRVRRQRARPRRVGHPGGPGHGRRCPRRGGRGLAAVGRARRRQGRRTAATARSRSTRPSPATASAPAPRRPSVGRRAGELQLLEVGPPVVIEIDYARGVARRPRGAWSRAPSGSAIAASATSRTTRSTAFRGFLVGNPAGRRRRPEPGHTAVDRGCPGRATGRAARPEVPVTPPLPRARPRDLGVHIGVLPPGPTDSIVDVAERPGRARDGLARRAGPARRPWCRADRGDRDRARSGSGSCSASASRPAPRSSTAPARPSASPRSASGASSRRRSCWTSSMAIGRVYDAAVAALVEVDEAAGIDDALMPAVAECDDGWLNTSRTVQVDAADVRAALADAAGPERGPVAGGVVGAGTGMICYEMKGGIGTASRVVHPIDRRDSHRRPRRRRRRRSDVHGRGHGPRQLRAHRAADDRRRPGRRGARRRRLAGRDPARPGARQLRGRRRDRRAAAGTGADAAGPTGRAWAWRGPARRPATARARSSSPSRPALRIPRGSGRALLALETIDDEYLDPFFAAVVEATEAAVLDALFRADTVEGRDGHVVRGLPVDRTLDLLRAAGQAARG